MKIYSLYSKSLKRYNLPFFAEDDEAAISTVSKMVTAQADAALICSLDDLLLVRVGAFDPENIEFPFADDFGVVTFMDDLHKNLPLPPTIKERLDKFYGGASNA